MSFDPHNLVGKQFGNYKILGELGRGGMAIVYKADEMSLNRVVALKIMSPKISEDEMMIKRFEREAQAAAQINHPNIVHIYAIGEEQGTHYFTMEYVKGKTLKQIVSERGALDAAEAIRIVRQVADALGEAHKAGLVHRDIKPSNIMLDAAGRVKVADFGLARVAHAHTQLTVDGAFLGTPQYMSPEQCEGQKADARSDIYSLGVTLYEILCGRSPFDADTPASLVMKIVKGDMRPIRQANPKVPPSVETVLAKMLHKNKEKRYRSAEELAAALDRLQTGVDEDATVAGTQTRVSGAGPARAAAKKKGDPWALIAVAALVLALVAGAGLWYWWSQQGPGAAENDAEQQPEQLADANEEPANEEPAPDTAADEPQPAAAEVAPAPAPDDAASAEPPAAVEAVPTEQPATAPDGAAVPPAAADVAAVAPANPPVPDANTGTDAGAQAGTEVDVQTDTPVPPPETPPAPGGTLDVADTPTQDQNAPALLLPDPAPAQPDADAAVTQTEPPPAEAGPDAQPPVAQQEPEPPPPEPVPPNSVVIQTTGDDEKAELITTFAQSTFRKSKFTVLEPPAEGDKKTVKDIAEYSLSIKLTPMGASTLNYYGRTTEIQTVVMTLKLIRAADGSVAAGPVNRKVEYTPLNADTNLREAVEKLAYELRKQLRQ
ncbi:MAG: serine/threonine protein kinase [Kiritimatiellae bacterium]|nr:serine/threonine protein kinase [Kiritimatiellia bacterium]